jgi:hypothetical protein
MDAGARAGARVGLGARRMADGHPDECRISFARDLDGGKGCLFATR